MAGSAGGALTCDRWRDAPLAPGLPVPPGDHRAVTSCGACGDDFRRDHVFGSGGGRPWRRTGASEAPPASGAGGHVAAAKFVRGWASVPALRGVSDG